MTQNLHFFPFSNIIIMNYILSLFRLVMNRIKIKKRKEKNLIGKNFKYYISIGKYELINNMIVKGFIPALEGLSIQDIKNVEDKDLLRLLEKKMYTDGIFLSLNKNAA